MPTYALPDPSGSGTIYASGNSLQEAEQTAASARGMASWTGGSFGAGSNPGASTSPNPGPTTINPQGLVNPNLGGLNALGAQVSGVTQAQLAQQKQEFDAQLQFAQQQMQQLGIPQLQINQQLAQLQQQQFQSQLALAQQAQQYSQAATTAGLTGYFNPPAGVPSVAQWTNPTGGGAASGAGATAGGGAAAANPQDQYVQARTQQLMSVAGMGQSQAQQTAQSEWGQGFAQSGNVAYGMPTGFSMGGQTTTGAPTTSGGTNPQDQYVQARTAQLQQIAGMPQAQASQTALSEWNQGMAQSGNVAGGMPPGFSMSGQTTTGAAGDGGGTNPQDQYMQARIQQLMSVAGMPQGQAQQTAQSEWSQGFAQSGNVAYGLPTGYSPAGAAAAPGASDGSQTPAGGGGGAGQQTLAGALQQAQLSGQYQGAPTEAASEFARQLAQAQQQFAAQQAQQQAQFEQSFGLQQGQLGQQYLSTAAQLQGPQNTFQLSNYLRGAQGNQAVPTYLQSLANNIGMPAFQGTGSTPPNTQTAAGLAGQLGGTTSATPGWDYNQTLGAIQGIMGQGAQSLGPGALERLSPDELSALGSGIGAAGGSLPSFLQQYQQSRIGQQAPTQTALA
jgi:hypothetical protein